MVVWKFLLEAFSGAVIAINVVVPFIQSKLQTNEVRVRAKSFSTRFTIAFSAIFGAAIAGSCGGLFLGNQIEKLFDDRRLDNILLVRNCLIGFLIGMFTFIPFFQTLRFFISVRTPKDRSAGFVPRVAAAILDSHLSLKANFVTTYISWGIVGMSIGFGTELVGVITRWLAASVN